MKISRYTFYLLPITAIAWVSCGKTIDRNPALYGRWTAKEWTINGEASRQDPSKIYFEFREDGTYSAGYRTEGEKGVWRTEKDKLYTTAEGKIEKVVRVVIEDSTTIQLQMNRNGVPETMELTKAQ